MNNIVVAVILLVSFPFLAAAQDSVSSKDLIIRYFKDQNVITSDAAPNSRKVFVVGQKVYSKIGNRESNTVNWIFIWDLETMIMLTKEEDQNVTLILKKGMDLWLFKQGLRVPLRINLSYQLNSQVNMFDVLQIGFDNYRIGGLIREEPSLKVELDSPSAGIPYPKVTLFFNGVSGDLERAVYKGASDKEIKEIGYKNYTMIGNNHRFPVMTIRNLLFQTKDVAQISYFDVQQIYLVYRYFSPQRESFEQFLDRFSSLYNKK